MTSFGAGDIVWVDFDPAVGTEQAGRRPAIVLTDVRFNIRDERSVVCPITSNVTQWPTKVILPKGMKTRGAVLVDRIRTVHRERRGFRFIETAPPEVVELVRTIVGELLGIGRD